MKKVLIGLLVISSSFAQASTFCGQVKEISSTVDADITREKLVKMTTQATVNNTVLKYIRNRELSLLVAAKANSLEVCVTQKTTQTKESRTISLGKY